MENTDVFKLIHAVELFTNEAIIRWTKAFSYNIGISPVIILGELKQHGPQKQTILANKLGYTPGAMTNIAGRLIAQGMAKRKYNENDRRHVLLEITDKGLDVLKEAQQHGNAFRAELFQLLDEEEIRQLLRIYEKLLKNFKE
ncbi:DNA-binding MarR family transcriptional regulator [Paenibacillus shirakamiensis]|uniref:DNA-binding MarR family transcriptional regulator n=1 Tax=Paenibacillus shirakamiensis TaxID=1265935 RepID=A0ABS4JJV9_9BACL|nr:MarR family transcriptional regulator [Paenibacillus shirakamiensis]MBP2001996.1 DNA-binding MarR family transcriptional regulator [Paenibacillus shirakamiensis]